MDMLHAVMKMQCLCLEDKKKAVLTIATFTDSILKVSSGRLLLCGELRVAKMEELQLRDRLDYLVRHPHGPSEFMLHRH